jgi:ABC-type multidrug transport system ATPase subunit
MNANQCDEPDRVCRDGIYLRNVCLSYSNHQGNVLNGVDLCASRGQIYGLLGPSGCGKSTLIRCTLGLQKPDFGDVKLFNHPPSRTCIGIPGPNVGYMPQEIALYDLLSIHETITYFGHVFGLGRIQVYERTLELSNLLLLTDLRQEVGKLSGGQKRRVSFAVAVLNRPPLILLDEPTAGVDPLLRQRLWTYLLQLCARHECTVLITTHYIEEARRADRVGFMRKGRVLCEGSPTELLESHRATTLEQVFLKLCNRKRKSIIASASELVHFKQAYQREKMLNTSFEASSPRSQSGSPICPIVPSPIL